MYTENKCTVFIPEDKYSWLLPIQKITLVIQYNGQKVFVYIVISEKNDNHVY